MTDILDLEPKLDTATKRERIEIELRVDPQRSNRAIAELVGCDHKTVGSVRAKFSPPNSPIPEDTPTNRRAMLIAAAQDFDRTMTPETAEEAVDNAVAAGKISLAPQTEPEDYNGEPLFRRQGEIYVHMNKFGELVLLEKNWPEDDHWICITRQNVPLLIERIQQVVREWDQAQ
ncbi:hypothetical protein RAD16_05145 [Bradyrhizobium sp. 18BD]